MKAQAETQRILLRVQELDTRAANLDHEARRLPERAILEKFEKSLDELRVRRLAEEGELEDARAELRRVVSDVELVDARIARDEAHAAQSSAAKDAQALESELASLRKRKDDLEDVQLAVMERVDELEARSRASQEEQTLLEASIEEARDSRDRALERIAAEREDVRADREAIARTVPAELLALYDRQRERYGIGAALLRGGVSPASNVALAPSDLEEIRRAAPDDVVIDPESGCILVRDENSGL